MISERGSAGTNERGSAATDHDDAAISEREVRVDGHRIRYYEGGDGPPLVLLHGGIVDAARCSWGEVLSPLASDFRVVAPDLLGYGASDTPDVTYSLARHVRTTRGFVDELDLDAPTVCGISMGGGIALGLELDTSADLGGLAVIDSYGLGRRLANGFLTYLLSRTDVPNKIAVALFRRSRRFTKASLGSVARDPDRLSPDAVDEVWRLARQDNACVAFRSFRRHEVTRDGYRTDFRPRLDRVSVPTLFVHGAHDDVFPVEWSTRAAERVPDAQVEVLPDCAHWAPREDPDRVVELLREFGSAR